MGSPPMNLIRGKVDGSGGGLSFARDGFALTLPDGIALDPAEAAGQVVLGLRPEAIRLAPQDSDTLAATVQQVEPRGPEAVLTLDCAGQSLKVIVPASGRPQEGADVHLAFDRSALVLFSGKTDMRLPLHAGEAA